MPNKGARPLVYPQSFNPLILNTSIPQSPNTPILQFPNSPNHFFPRLLSQAKSRGSWPWSLG